MMFRSRAVEVVVEEGGEEVDLVGAEEVEEVGVVRGVAYRLDRRVHRLRTRPRARRMRGSRGRTIVAGEEVVRGAFIPMLEVEVVGMWGSVVRRGYLLRRRELLSFRLAY